MSESKWVLREVLFDNGQPIAHREPHDWSMLEAAKESLREHMTEIHRLRRVNAELLGVLKELVEIVDGAISDRSTGNMDSFTLQPARIAITKAEDKP